MFATAMQELRGINEFVQLVVEVARGSGDWEVAYDLVFCKTVSQRVFQLCRDSGTSLDYYDPDTTYEEDTIAFANALSDFVNRRSSFLDAISS